jgi:RHS repeat-associated protein
MRAGLLVVASLGCLGRGGGAPPATKSESALVLQRCDGGGNEFLVGRLTATASGAGGQYLSYDSLGRVRMTRVAAKALPAGVYCSTTAYDAGGRVQAETRPDGETLTYGYDHAGALSHVDSSRHGTLVAGALRNPSGQLVQVSFGDGSQRQYSYDAATERLDAIRVQSGSFQQLEYGYDAADNVTSVNDHVDSGDAAHTLQSAYVYDGLNRLARMSTSSLTPPPGCGWGARCYGYDTTYGNLVTKDDITQSYLDGNGTPGGHVHAVKSHGTRSYSYDPLGSLIARTDTAGPTRNLIWDADRELVAVADGGAVTGSYAYLAGARVAKTETKGSLKRLTYYVPGGREIVLTFGKSGSDETRSYFFAGERIAEETPGGQLIYLHGDHLGSRVTAASSPAAFTAARSYWPYGEQRASWGDDSKLPKWGFSGKEHDDTGFVDFGARLYDPETGRWLSADPIATDGFDRYAYVGNNPLKYVDPTGHQREINPQTGKWCNSTQCEENVRADRANKAFWAQKNKESEAAHQRYQAFLRSEAAYEKLIADVESGRRGPASLNKLTVDEMQGLSRHGFFGVAGPGASGDRVTRLGIQHDRAVDVHGWASPEAMYYLIKGAINSTYAAGRRSGNGVTLKEGILTAQSVNPIGTGVTGPATELIYGRLGLKTNVSVGSERFGSLSVGYSAEDEFEVSYGHKVFGGEHAATEIEQPLAPGGPPSVLVRAPTPISPYVKLGAHTEIGVIFEFRGVISARVGR